MPIISAIEPKPNIKLIIDKTIGTTIPTKVPIPILAALSGSLSFQTRYNIKPIIGGRIKPRNAHPKSRLSSLFTV